MNQQSAMVMDAIEQALPPFFSRDEVANHLSGILTKKSLANIECSGRGVAERAKIGKRIVYERSSFMCWLREYSKESV